MINDPQKHIPNHILQAYLDQDLGSAESSEVKEHLVGCERCRTAYKGLENTILQLAALPEIDLKVDLSSEVIAELRNQKKIPRGITWTLILEAIGAGTIIGLLIPAIRAASWIPDLLDTPNEIQAAINIFFTQLASSWLVWWAGIQMELDQLTDSIFSGGNLPALEFSPWILILTAGGIGILINYLFLRMDTGQIRSGNRKNQ
jgi:hypothetical protein